MPGYFLPKSGIFIHSSEKKMLRSKSQSFTLETSKARLHRQFLSQQLNVIFVVVVEVAAISARYPKSFERGARNLIQF